MIDKIEIKTPNENHAIDIATLVDKIGFMQEIKRLRDKWQITELEKSIVTPNILQIINIHNTILKRTKSPEEVREREKEFNNDIDEILNKFNRGKNFKNIVEYALFTGSIPDGAYKSSYFDIVTINEPEDLSKPEKYQYVIVMSPRAELQEVRQAFNEFKNHIKNKIQFYSRTFSKLQENGDLITEAEIKEFDELAIHIETEYKKYKKKIKNLSDSDAAIEYTKFSKKTQKKKEKYDALRHKLPLYNDPDYIDLSDQYHKGNIYDSAIIDVGTNRYLERTRKWYWMRFGDYINGISIKPKTFEDVAEIWNNKCPLYPSTDIQHRKNCYYCHVTSSNIAHALSTYNKLLEQ